ncbi:aldehyde dehydrogenase [Ahrensia marina]|uniref:Aldehyde dehydrogenase n=1 Tax=Ahrensia marina TaxID=1514904 RepID=A0A0M9GL50_9HYPH|nr:aldehyde dehydrogenase [Ahrensia marina]
MSSSNPVAAGIYIDGAWFHPKGREIIEVESPTDESVIASIVDGTADDAAMAVEAAQKAFTGWAGRPAIERARLVMELASEVQANHEALARIVTLEQGKPIAQARGEIDAVITFLTYAAENARRIEGDIVASDNLNEEIQIRRHPYGVVVGLTAWNYPAALAARKLGPALVAGNTFVLMAHEHTPLSGLALAQLAHNAGFPAGVFNSITGRGRVAGQAMLEHPLTAMVTMTGSTRAGKEIFRTAADTIKTVRLELGGKAPFIVMDDADIDAAVAAAVLARYTNCGQICTCNERMYLHSSIADEFMGKFVAASQALTIGDPMAAVDLGPKISRFERDKVAGVIAASVEAGAEVLLEGGILDSGQYAQGHWMAPTVLSVKNNKIPAIRDEVFGPVAVAMTVDSFDEAVALANDTQYGLSAYLFTKNFKHIQLAPHVLKFGELYLNRSNGEAVQGFHTGWGMSGLGGEDGKYGFDGYMRKQTSYLNWD